MTFEELIQTLPNEVTIKFVTEECKKRGIKRPGNLQSFFKQNGYLRNGNSYRKSPSKRSWQIDIGEKR